MVDKAIYEQVHQWMEAHKENMIHDIQRIVKIPSISNPVRKGKTVWCCVQTGYG